MQTEVIEIEESPMPTRNARLMSSESHRRMAESVRARRRGGTTEVWKPQEVGDQTLQSLLQSTTVDMHAFLEQRDWSLLVEELRSSGRQQQKRVYHAYIEDEYVRGMSVRSMVQDTEHDPTGAT